MTDARHLLFPYFQKTFPHSRHSNFFSLKTDLWGRERRSHLPPRPFNHADTIHVSAVSEEVPVSQRTPSVGTDSVTLPIGAGSAQSHAGSFFLHVYLRGACALGRKMRILLLTLLLVPGKVTITFPEDEISPETGGGGIAAPSLDQPRQTIGGIVCNELRIVANNRVVAVDCDRLNQPFPFRGVLKIFLCYYIFHFLSPTLLLNESPRANNSRTQTHPTKWRKKTNLEFQRTILSSSSPQFPNPSYRHKKSWQSKNQVNQGSDSIPHFVPMVRGSQGDSRERKVVNLPFAVDLIRRTIESWRLSRGVPRAIFAVSPRWAKGDDVSLKNTSRAKHTTPLLAAAPGCIPYWKKRLHIYRTSPDSFQ